MQRAGHGAGVVARLAVAADFGPDVVNSAGGGLADFARQRRATIPVTTHAREVGGYQLYRDQRQRVVAL